MIFFAVPIGIVVALLYAGNLQCEGFSNVYFVCFYLSRSNRYGVKFTFILRPLKNLTFKSQKLVKKNEPFIILFRSNLFRQFHTYTVNI